MLNPSFENNCPYQDAVNELCTASIHGMIRDLNMNVRYCNSGNFDNCAIFLSKCLRMLSAKENVCYQCNKQDARRYNNAFFHRELLISEIL